MTSTENLERTRRGAGLSGREVRRLVDLVLAAESDGRQVTALSRVVPGLNRDDARVVRDELLRRRAAANQPVAAIVSINDAEPTFASAAIVGDGRVRVAAAPELFVQAVAGVTLTQAGLRALMNGAGAQGFEAASARTGLVAFANPFRPDDRGPEDLVAANGGLCALAVSPRPEIGATNFTVHRGDELLGTGRATHASESWSAALEAVVTALESCAPHRERRAGFREGAGPFPGLVFATALGPPVTLNEGETVALMLDGRLCATVTATSDRQVLTGVSK
jgi:hypothetical protein